MDQFQVQKHGDEAAELRLWRHAIGIVSEVQIISGSDEHRSISEQAGAAIAGRWGTHYFILTAKHVVEGAEPKDLRLATMPSDWKNGRMSPAEDIPTLNMNGRSPHIQRCEWEDLALLDVLPDSLGANVEFVDIATSWIDPPEGERVHGVGFPISDGILASSKQIGGVNYRSVMLSPIVFFGEVSHQPTFLTNDFNSDRHYLFSYELAKQGSSPPGISGAAAWVQEEPKGPVWAPTFTFAGICTHAYKDRIERVLKASIVRQFLEEIFGPAGR